MNPKHRQRYWLSLVGYTEEAKRRNAALDQAMARAVERGLNADTILEALNMAEKDRRGRPWREGGPMFAGEWWYRYGTARNDMRLLPHGPYAISPPIFPALTPEEALDIIDAL